MIPTVPALWQQGYLRDGFWIATCPGCGTTLAPPGERPTSAHCHACRTDFDLTYEPRSGGEQGRPDAASLRPPTPEDGDDTVALFDIVNASGL